MISPVQTLTDQAIRERFTSELERNFSVIAPAGVGKTTAIARRIAHMALAPNNHASILPRLVVVTYTHRAADEMRARARTQLLEAHAALPVLNLFQQAFFGTIHGFCVQLLQRYGYHLGLPGECAVIQAEDLADEALWQTFIRENSALLNQLYAQKHASLLRFVSLRQLLELARKQSGIGVRADASALSMPPLDFTDVLRCQDNPRSKGGVAAGQALLKRWLTRLQSQTGFVGLPAYTKGGKEFVALWQASFAPLQSCLHGEAWKAVQDIAQAYRQFRLSQGLLTYDDQISLAADLLQHARAAAAIRAAGYRVILDEAQDTDPRQFTVLTGISRPAEARGNWLSHPEQGPRPGHFCMVGDPQQSIYSARASLTHYLAVHEALVNGGGEALTFDVTFRCATAIVNAVNGLAPWMLDGQDQQVNFVPLHPRPEAPPGKVSRLLAQTHMGAATSVPDKGSASFECEFLAHWLSEKGLSGLQLENWSQLAILAPRRDWLKELETALQDLGLKTQIHSQKELRSAHPLPAWTAALVKVLLEPHNAYEIVGVLREIYGISDDALAHFCQGQGERFQIAEPPETLTPDPVAETLTQLCQLRQTLLALPLGDALHTLWQKCGLLERIQALGPWNGLALELESHRLRALALEAEQQGLALGQWSSQLLNDLGQQRESVCLIHDAIQLISCHKSKGLEWHTVLVPFMFRPKKTRSPDYPFVLHKSAEQLPVVAFDRTWIDDHVIAQMHSKIFKENQRLLYVTLTRARQHLILVDDESLFAALKKDQTHMAADLGLLQASNRSFWNNIPLTDQISPMPTPLADLADPPWPSAHHQTFDLQAAQAAAQRFLKRVLPHRLIKATAIPQNTKAALDFDDLEPPKQDSALRYGLWWHSLMQALPWPQGPHGWQKMLDARVAEAPDPRRIQHEWELFLKSELFQCLQASNLIFHPELAFAVPWETSACLEGSIALAVWNLNTHNWLLVDWKTDRLPKHERSGTNGAAEATSSHRYPSRHQDEFRHQKSL